MGALLNLHRAHEHSFLFVVHHRTMAVGYVLVNVQPGSELEVFQSIAGLDMVQDATLLFGDYDIIVKMTAGRMSDIAAAVVEHVRQIEGVTDTKTLAGAEL